MWVACARDSVSFGLFCQPVPDGRIIRLIALDLDDEPIRPFM
jgi:hypothetical protein